MEARSARETLPTSANGESSSAAALTSEAVAEAPRRRAAPPKRKAAASNFSASSSSSSASNPAKRFAKERNSQQVLPALHNGPSTRTRQSPNKPAASSPQTLLDAGTVVPSAAGEGSKGLLSARGEIESEDKVVIVAEEPFVDSEFDAVRSRGVDVHVVPTHAGWFSWKRSRQLEKYALPSFFNGKSETRTPEIYMEIRNSIVRRFHADPQTELELKDFSELSSGDMDARREVFEFLDHWGLINFHPFPPSSADASLSDAEAVTKIDQLFEFETVQSLPCAPPRNSDVSAPASLRRLLPEPDVPDDLVKPDGPSVEYHCNSCSADCSRKRYHCQKQADFDLCTECYNNGNFGSSMALADFILMEPADAPGAGVSSWTDQETLLLLEALELFGENWNEIAEHVATKTKAQCILYFLQMPIEDPFLEEDDGTDDLDLEIVGPNSAVVESAVLQEPEIKGADSGGDKVDPVSPSVDALKPKDSEKVEVLSVSDKAPLADAPSGKDVKTEVSLRGASVAIDVLKNAFQAVGCYLESGDSFTFAQAGNPVMILVAFLAALVAPNAATSICSSLKAMLLASPGLQISTRHCFCLEDPPNYKKEPSTTNSAVSEKGPQDGPFDENGIPVKQGKEELEVHACKSEENTTAIAIEKEKLPKTLEVQESLDIGGSTKETSPMPEERETGEKDATVLTSTLEKNSNSEDEEDDDDHNFDRVKRAAVTVLSAAAVKAKLLAIEEEDKIRQLVSLVIDKQLQKLETKMAFYTEFESVVVTVREQIDRARQRLFHERAQIVAARSAQSRTNPPSLLANRIATIYNSGVPRPNFAPQRPPLFKRF